MVDCSKKIGRAWELGPLYIQLHYIMWVLSSQRTKHRNARMNHVMYILLRLQCNLQPNNDLNILTSFVVMEAEDQAP